MTSTVTQATIDAVAAAANDASTQPYFAVVAGLLVLLLAVQVLLRPSDEDAAVNGGAGKTWATGLNVAIVPLTIVFTVIAGSTIVSLVGRLP